METPMRLRLFIVAGLFFGCLAVGRGGDWPQFRGPAGSAVAVDKGPPTEWGDGKNVAWTAELPGYGWSSPVVWGDKVFVTTAVSDKQQKPSGGMGGMGGGFPGGPGGSPGGFGGPAQPGQLVVPFVQDRLKLTDEQKKKLEELQKDVDGKLA